MSNLKTYNRRTVGIDACVMHRVSILTKKVPFLYHSYYYGHLAPCDMCCCVDATFIMVKRLQNE